MYFFCHTPGSMFVVSTFWEADVNYCCEIYFALCIIRQLQDVVGKVKRANKELNVEVNRLTISQARCVLCMYENISHAAYPLLQ